MNSATIVQKLWNYCNVLRDDGMSYGRTAHQWPQDCLALAGRFADFPLIDAASVGSLPTDPPRLAF